MSGPQNQNQPKPNDAALRAAQEKAARLERELAETKRQLAANQPAAARAPNAREKCEGTKRFTVGPRGFYGNGVKYEPGDTVTITNEIPGVDWVPLEDEKPSKKAAPKKDDEGDGEKRDADTQI